MPIANFELFSKALCESAGIPSPQLAADAFGAQCFTVEVEGIFITALQIQNQPDRAYLMAELGPLPQDNVDEVLRALMNENLSGQNSVARVFGCDSESEHVVLQQTCSLSRMEPAEVMSVFCSLALIAAKWFDANFLLEPSTLTPDAPEARDIDNSRFTFELGAAPPEQESVVLRELLEANFSWMTFHPSCVSGRDATTGDLFIQIARTANTGNPADSNASLGAVMKWASQRKALEIHAPTSHWIAG